MTVELTYRYRHPSTMSGTGLLLSTSGGPVAHPRFFDGFLERPAQNAAAMLVVARVARTRFYTPPAMVTAQIRAADPVITSNGDRLRFESFSACCGVYARLDLLPESLDRPPLGTGTTNVDFNPPMRDALSGVAGSDPLHLSVGADDVTVTTFDSDIVERRVPLPARWLKGFAEVQLTCSQMSVHHGLSATQARHFIQALPKSGATRGPALWTAPSGRGLRLTTRPGPVGVAVSGPERLRPLEPLLRFARGLRVYGADGASGWQLDLDGARLTLVLSPAPSRGFSGEGGVLFGLSDDQAADDADLVAALLAFEPTLDPVRLAAEAGISERRILHALPRLAAAGRVGFDLAAGAYFHRELPYDPEALNSMHPRLRDAQALVDAGAVRIDGRIAVVQSGQNSYQVRDSSRCTCPWYGKHRDSRGPCKHILAVRISSR